jgi:hypothetical protein
MAQDKRVYPTNPGQPTMAAVLEVQRVMQRQYDRHHEQAMRALEALVRTGTDELVLMRSGRTSGYTDFVASKARDYHDALLAMQALNEALAGPAWLQTGEAERYQG